MVTYTYDSSGNLLTASVSKITMRLIISQPARVIAAPGEIASFSVVVSNPGKVTFQWKFNNENIPGATGDSLLLTDVGEDNEGQYSVVVTQNGKSVTSASAALMLDWDRDGLPDAWEAVKFTDPNPKNPLHPANQRSDTDPDKDGVSNLDEFLDGTDPISAFSMRPRLVVLSSAGGSVRVTPMKLSYDFGEMVILKAHPTLSTSKVQWTGDLSGSDNPATITMDKHKTVRASFASAVPLPPGLIASWRGETNASDVMGGHHGAFFAGTTNTVSKITALGKVGRAFEFDGIVYIRVPDSPALRPAQLTAEAWVFPTEFKGGNQAIIAKGSFTNTWFLAHINGVPQFWSHGGQLLQCPFAIPLNKWTHLAITYDGLVKRIYVNGLQAATHAEPGALIYNALPVTIGSDWLFTQPEAHYFGRIDEVAIYDRALTADEILGIYNADFAGKNFSKPYFKSPTQLPDGVLGANYTQQLVAILGTGILKFSLSAGTLPPGLTLSPDGMISGVPGTAGTFGFTVRAKDAAGAFTNQLFTLKV